jgi:hypothetical protein
LVGALVVPPQAASAAIAAPDAESARTLRRLTAPMIGIPLSAMLHPSPDLITYGSPRTV